MKKVFTQLLVAIFMMLCGPAAIVQSQCQQTFWPWDVNCFGSIGSTIYAGSNAFVGMRSLIVSTDTGKTWTMAGTPRSMGTVHGLIAHGHFLYGGSDSGLFRRSDTDTNWVRLSNFPAYSVSVFAKAESTLFVQDFRSSDEGGTWIQRKYPQFLRSLYWKSPYLFAGTEGNGIFRSSDSGNTWNEINNGIDLNPQSYTSGFNSITAIGDHLFAVDAFGPCYVSTNDGSSWTPTNSNSNEGSDNYHLIANGQMLFACSQGGGGGPFITTDFGVHWEDVGSPPRNNSIYVFGGYLFTGTNATGVWRRPLSDFNGLSVSSKSETNDLVRIYPNPTNGLVTIHGASRNQVTVVNLLGQTMQVIAASTDSSVSTDLSKLPAGTYFARIISSHSITTKMIIKQ